MVSTKSVPQSLATTDGRYFTYCVTHSPKKTPFRVYLDVLTPAGTIGELPFGSGTSLETSYPTSSSYGHLAATPSPDPTDTDITDRLESLCLSVTEHALG